MKRRTASQDAANWLARLDMGTADPEAFEVWRSASADNQVAFARTVALAEAAARDADGAEAPSAVSRRTALRAAGAGAALLCVGMAGLSTRAYAWSTASSDVGQCRTIILPDGSGARLNTDSKLSWRFNDDARTFWVERGEVALNLKAGPDALLHGPTETLALSPGLFNARLRADSLDLLVLRGQARIAEPEAAGRPPMLVKAGQGLLLPAGAPVVRTTSAHQVAATLAWQKGEILFENETLGSAVEEYNRYLARKIVVVDRDLANIPVGGRFTSNEPGPFLHALELGLGVKVSTSDEGYFLTH